MTCSYDNCSKPKRYTSLGLCNTHYYRIRRNGTLELKNDGHSNSKMYRRWNSMRQRCNNPQDAAYRLYGARGIKVCERWNNYFNYLADVTQPPSDKHSLDRIDNDGDYEPGNVRWVLRDIQTHNQRSRSATGYKGVYRFRNKYRASITRGKKRIYLGTFSDPKLAYNKYLLARKELYGY